jgi:hypothetical protein
MEDNRHMRLCALCSAAMALAVCGCGTHSSTSDVRTVEVWLAAPATSESVPRSVMAAADRSIDVVGPVLIDRLSGTKEIDKVNAEIVVAHLAPESGMEFVRQVAMETEQVQDQCLLAVEVLYKMNYDKRDVKAHSDLVDAIATYLRSAASSDHENLAYRAKHIVSRRNIGR